MPTRMIARADVVAEPLAEYDAADEFEYCDAKYEYECEHEHECECEHEYA